MEIGHQAANRLESVTRCDEDVGVTFERVHDALCIRCAFNQAERRCANRDQPPASCADIIQPFGSFGVNTAPLAMHAMCISVVGLNGQECARTHMQCQRRRFDTCRLDCMHQFRCEVQRGRGRGNGAILLREHRLIILRIACVGRALARNIGW